MAKMVLPMTNTPSQLLGVTGILRESVKLPSRNGKLMLSTTLLVLLPFSLLALSHNLLVGPLMEDLEVQEDEQGFEWGQKDIRNVLGLELAFLVPFFAVFLFGLTSAINASAMTYIGQSLSLKELLLRIRTTWMKLVITWLNALLITVAYMVLVLVLIGAFLLVSMTEAVAVWIGLVGILAALFYFYLAAVWALALVISVVEEDCHGMKAIGKALDLIRGRNIQGFFLMLFLVLLSSPISISFYIITSDDDLGLMTQLAFGFVATVLLCIAKLFTFVVYTVFYYECKKSHGEKVEMEMGSGYGLVSHQAPC